MGLRSDVQTEVAAALDSDLADAVRSFTASRETVSDVFDPVSGTYPTTPLAYSGRGVFSDYETNEIDSQHILANDQRLLAIQTEVTRDSDGSTLAPAVDDIIDGYRVVTVGKDPADAIYEVQLRKT